MCFTFLKMFCSCIIITLPPLLITYLEYPYNFFRSLATLCPNFLTFFPPQPSLSICPVLIFQHSAQTSLWIPHLHSPWPIFLWNIFWSTQLRRLLFSLSLTILQRSSMVTGLWDSSCQQLCFVLYPQKYFIHIIIFNLNIFILWMLNKIASVF